MSLTVWLKAGHTVEIIRRRSANFTEATGVDVDLVVVPEGEAHDRLLSDVQRPDVVTVPYWYLDELLAHEVLRPVDEGLSAPDLDWASFAPSAVEALSRNGHRWAAPHTLTGGVVSYRADLFGQAGLEPPTTTEDVLGAARKLGSVDGPVHGLVARASGEFSSLETYAGWAWARGVRLLPDVGEPQPEAVEEGVADLVAALRDTAPRDLPTRDYAAVGQLMADGRAAVLFDTSAWAFFLEDRHVSAVAGRMGYTTVTGPVAPAQFLYAEGLGVTGWSRQPAAAARFITWRQSHDVLRSEVEDLGRIDVPRTDLWDTDWFAAALDDRGLAGYMEVVRRSWAESDVTHVSTRPDFVAAARRLMTAISGAVEGRYPSVTAAVAAVLPPAERAG